MITRSFGLSCAEFLLLLLLLHFMICIRSMHVSLLHTALLAKSCVVVLLVMWAAGFAGTVAGAWREQEG